MYFIMFLLTLLPVSQESQQDHERQYDMRVFLHSFTVSRNNQLNVIKPNMIQSPVPRLFGQTVGFGNMLLETQLSTQLDFKKSEQQKIKAIIKSLQTEKVMMDAYQNSVVDENVLKELTEAIDNDRKSQIFELLSSNQRRALETQLAYRSMCQFGLLDWLETHQLLDPQRERLIRQVAEKGLISLNEKTRVAAVTYRNDILGLISDDSKIWETIVGNNNEWIPTDTFLTLLQCHIETDDLTYDTDINELFGKLAVGELEFKVENNGAISAVPDKMGLANGCVQLLIVDRSYGGIDLTKSQIIDIQRATIPTKAENAELSIRFAKIQERYAHEGFDSIEVELKKVLRDIAKWNLERVENTLLDHQKHALEAIIKRRIVGVCGLDIAVDMFVLPQLVDGAEIRRQLMKKREAYVKNITDLHKSFAKEVWGELKKEDSGLVRDIRKMAPKFDFSEIENPSLLFRLEPGNQKK